MTRIERIAPYIEALSDDAFESLLEAAAHAAGPGTIYATLPAEEKAEIDAAIARLDAGAGMSYDEFKALRDAGFKAVGA